MTDKYIFHYFKANARGMLTKAILSSSKKEWTNDIIEFDKWKDLKKSGLCEFEQLPVLEHNNKKLCQSLAIDLYLLKQFNLYGKNDEEEYQINSLFCTFEDLFDLPHKLIFLNDEKKKEEIKNQFVEKFKLYLKKYEERYVSLGKGKYFLGEHFSGADIYIGSALPYFCDIIGKDIVKENCPNLFELIERLKNNELKEFFEKYYFKDSSI